MVERHLDEAGPDRRLAAPAAGRALAAANRAIELDRTRAEGYAARGLLVSRMFGPPAFSAADFGRALDIATNPGPGLYLERAKALAAAGA